LISFTLLGIEEIGLEIENPFGYDTNDLPLDHICNTIKDETEEFITYNLSLKPNSEKIYQEDWNDKKIEDYRPRKH